jgi:hypothetical protein
VAAVPRDAAPRPLGDFAPHGVEYDVDTRAVRRPQYGLGEVLRAIVDRKVRSQLAAEARLLGPSGGSEDPGTGGPGDLHGGRADSAGRRVHEHALTARNACTLEQTQPRQVKWKEERRRLPAVQAGRCLEYEVDGCQRLLGKAALRSFGTGHDTLAEPGLGSLTGGIDGSRHLHARRVGERRVHRAVAPVAAVDVVHVEDGVGYRDPHLPRTWLRRLDVVEA